MLRSFVLAVFLAVNVSFIVPAKADPFPPTGDASRFPKAAKIVIQSANNGTLDAECVLGYMSLTGVGIKKDAAEAAAWYKKAAVAGCGFCANALALQYLGGIGVPQNIEAAKSWLAKGNGTLNQNLRRYLEKQDADRANILKNNPWADKANVDAGANFALAEFAQQLLDAALQNQYAEIIRTLTTLEES